MHPWFRRSARTLFGLAVMDLALTLAAALVLSAVVTRPAWSAGVWFLLLWLAATGFHALFGIHSPVLGWRRRS